jgi:hypothetical protein
MPTIDTTNKTDTFYAGEAIVGYGAQLLVGNGASPEVFEAIADVMTITPGEISSAIIDKTHLRSPDGHREKTVGLTDSGPFTITGNWRPKHSSQSYTGGGSGAFASGGLPKLLADKTEKNFKIKLVTPVRSTEWPFRGIVSKFQPGAISGDERISFTAEITPLRSYLSSLP